MRIGRTLPPTAAPIYLRHLVAVLTGLRQRQAAVERLRADIRAYFGCKYVFLLSSGKAAIYLALSALQGLSKRTEVVVPAYSSFCLASSLTRSGLRVKLCDVDPETLDFDLEQLRGLITDETLAVVPVHTYGLISELGEIKSLASEKGAYVLEDAAQAAGAEYAGIRVGAVGDVGILSLGRGKNIYALGGGVALTSNREIADAVERLLDGCDEEPKVSFVLSLAEALALYALIRPTLYTIPSNLPFLKLGANIFNPVFKVAVLSSLKAPVVRKVLSNLDDYNRIRVDNANSYRDGLIGNDSVKIPKPCRTGRSVYLRFPVVFGAEGARTNALKILNRKGAGCSTTYPNPLSEIRGFAHSQSNDNKYPGAEYVSRRILTLPTHPYVSGNDISRILSSLNNE